MRLFLNLSHLVECPHWAARAMELELQAALGITVMFAHATSAEAGGALTGALDVAAMLEDRWSQLTTLARLYIFHEHVGGGASVEADADRAVAIAGEISEPDAMAIACIVTSMSIRPKAAIATAAASTVPPSSVTSSAKGWRRSP